MSTPKSTPAKPRKSQWKQDPDAVRADILKVAASDFAIIISPIRTGFIWPFSKRNMPACAKAKLIFSSKV
jgi:hypothetical protein